VKTSLEWSSTALSCLVITVLLSVVADRSLTLISFWASVHSIINVINIKILQVIFQVLTMVQMLSATQTEANELTELRPNVTFSKKPILWDRNSKCFLTDNKSWHCLISILQILIHCGVPLGCFPLWLVFAYFSRYSTHSFCYWAR